MKYQELLSLKNKKCIYIYFKTSSAAVVIGALRVKEYSLITLEKQNNLDEFHSSVQLVYRTE